VCVCLYMCVHTHTHTHTRTHTGPPGHISRPHNCEWWCRHRHTPCTYLPTPRPTHTHTRTHTHIYTHTHTQGLLVTYPGHITVNGGADTECLLDGLSCDGPGWAEFCEFVRVDLCDCVPLLALLEEVERFAAMCNDGECVCVLCV